MTLVLALVVAVAGCSGDVDVKPPAAPRDQTSRDAGGAQEALDELERALEDRVASAAEEVATSGAKDDLAAVAANAASLDLRDLSMRYVDEADPLTSSEQSRFGDDAWSGDVELQYAIGGIDRTPARVETSVVFVPDGGRVRIAGFGAGNVRTPLWLVERLSVVRRGETVTAVAGATAGRYPGLVTRALAEVRRTLPAWRGPLVVEVPSSQAELDAALESGADKYDDIAAVTTTEDGSLAVGSPVRVFVNPAVFDKLADRGAQVVMSHEATHVATGATFVSMPTWLLEGFADYVALAHAGVPVALAAGQILARIRKKGLPERLPTSADLDPSASGLGATYEEAWLACRFAAQQYGEPRLIAFYRAVSGGQKERRAFPQVLGTTEKEFVRRWRADLAGLAGVPGGA